MYFEHSWIFKWISHRLIEFLEGERHNYISQEYLLSLKTIYTYLNNLFNSKYTYNLMQKLQFWNYYVGINLNKMSIFIIYYRSIFLLYQKVVSKIFLHICSAYHTFLKYEVRIDDLSLLCWESWKYFLRFICPELSTFQRFIPSRSEVYHRQNMVNK